MSASEYVDRRKAELLTACRTQDWAQADEVLTLLAMDGHRGIAAELRRSYVAQGLLPETAGAR